MPDFKRHDTIDCWFNYRLVRPFGMHHTNFKLQLDSPSSFHSTLIHIACVMFLCSA